VLYTKTGYVSEKVIEKIKSQFSCSVTPPPEHRAVCELMCKNIVQLNSLHMTIRRMRIACWIPRATDRHSEYVMLVAFPLQQRLDERASLLRYTYMACHI